MMTLPQQVISMATTRTRREESVLKRVNMQISGTVGTAAIGAMTDTGMGRHLILLSESQIAGYLRVRARLRHLCFAMVWP